MPKSSPEEPTLPLPERIRRYYAEANGLKIALGSHRSGMAQELAGYGASRDEAKASIDALVKRYSSPHMEGFARGILPQVNAIYEALPTVSASWEEMVASQEDLLNKANSLLYDLQIQHAEEKRRRQILEYTNGKLHERVNNLIRQVVALHPDDEELLRPLVDRITEARVVPTTERDLEEELELGPGA